MSESPSAERHKKLLKKYVIPNMGDYTAVGGVLSSILDRLDKHKLEELAQDQKDLADKAKAADPKDAAELAKKQKELAEELKKLQEQSEAIKKAAIATRIITSGRT